LKYEELHEIRKMTRRGYQESRQEREAEAEAAKEADDKAERAVILQEAQELGYEAVEIDLLPEGVSVLEGCGNPLGNVEIKPGWSVIVAGCRTGADCFIAGANAGAKGHVVGVEETPEDITKAREAARSFTACPVEIRPGECENLPAADKSFDLAVTNCSVTFSYDKARVLKELFRVLKPGGRLIMCEPAIPKETAAAKKRAAIKNVECLENAFYKDEIKTALKRAGFKKISLSEETAWPASRILRDKRVKAAISSGDMTAKVAADIAKSIVSSKTTALRP
jgi:arsenite methyltransferase